MNRRNVWSTIAGNWWNWTFFRGAWRAGLLLFTLMVLAIGNLRSEAPTSVSRLQGRQICREVTLTGEVGAGKEWMAAIGEGWLFRVMPIRSSDSSVFSSQYSGWDLVIDREDPLQAGGYPDALLLGTPPYGSLNEREIGTTYGMRAQDAIAWEPRRFRFLTNVKEWKRARDLYSQVMPGSGRNNGSIAAAQRGAESELLGMVGGTTELGRGEFSVLNARLATGVADPPAFARQWAMHLSQVPHVVEQSNDLPSPLGRLLWMRFRIDLWLPTGWKLPRGISVEQATCAQ